MDGYTEAVSGQSQFCKGVCEEMTLVHEAKESPLLGAVARERPVKTAGWKRLSGCCVISKLWRLAMALYLLVLTSGMYKWSINLFTNPNPVYSHTYYT
jgi:hypothetical protein